MTLAAYGFVEDLIYYFGAQLGYVYGTHVFRGPNAKLPATDGPFLSIIETGGTGAEGTHNSTSVPAYVRPGAQMLWRAKSYDVCRAEVQRGYDLLYPVRNQLINGTWWRELHILSEPFDLPIDENGRVRIAFNISAVKRTSPATSV